MSRRISEEIIQEIRDRADIVEVISSYVSLKRSGANNQGLCPFHSEKTPSFNVNSTRQIFHCFGCGVGGNVFSFLMQIEGLSFPEAVRRIGEKVGVEVPDEEMTPAEEKRREEFDRLARINEVAAEFYHQILIDSDEGGVARRYLRQRGYDAETVKAFQLGYAPESWESLVKHLEEKGFDPKLVRDKTGLIREGKEGRGDYDLFRKRLLFPIHDVRGQVVAFGGRVLDDSLPKYINSPESPIYNKSRILFGLYQAREAMRRAGYGIVVEGYFDQMALFRNDFTNAVATCGTALTGEHGRLLKRYAEKVLLLFDQDKAGLAATFRSMEVLLPQGLSVAVVDLGDGEDPDSFLAARGPDEMQARLDAARPVLDFFIETTLREHGDGIEGKARAVEQILEKFRLLKSDIERDLYIKGLSERTGLDEARLRSQFSRSSGAARQARDTSPSTASTAAQTRPRKDEAPAEDQLELKAQRWVLGLMIEHAEICQRVLEEGVDNYFIDPEYLAIAELIPTLGDEGIEVDFDALQNRLNDDQIRLLAGVLLKDKDALADSPDSIFEGCRKTLFKGRDKKRYRELQQRLKKPDQQITNEELEEFQKLKKKL
ncbi:MAG: DNA primase [Desulfuromonas sp.]|nr:MAG: DNA primase [Desulfuromonas sp.]